MNKLSSFMASRKAARSLAYLQWGIPIALSITAMGAELIEHKIEGELHFDALFFAELLTFGLFGPLIVAWIVRYLHRLVDDELRLADELKTLNQELEQRVAERTAELEQSNRELSRANAELLKLDELKSEFVSMVSHELRAPLTALNGGLELAMQTADTLPPKSREILEIMTAESRRLTDFVQSILDVSRLEAGKLEILPGPVAVRPLVEQAAAVVMASSQRDIDWNIADNIPPVWGDEIYLEQVIRNLIRNADNYSSGEYPIHICASQQGDQVRIGVKDYGPGIAPENQAHIFDRFTRLQNDERAPAGWGLGLYLGKKFLAAQQGSIHIDSPLWDDPQCPGSEFYILMPIAQAPEEEL